MHSLHFPLACRTTTGFANHLGCSTPLTKPAALKFLDIFCNELLPLQGLFLDFLLDRSGMWADSKVVLDYLPGNTGDIRWLPGKHIDIRPQEGNERAFLSVIEGGTDSESTISAS